MLQVKTVLMAGGNGESPAIYVKISLLTGPYQGNSPGWGTIPVREEGPE